MTAINHSVSASDAAAMGQLRALMEGAKGTIRGPEARPMFDEMMGHVAPAVGVTAEEATLSGVPGWWVRPAAPAAGRAILYLYGGAYVLGSATAYRNFTGQIVARSGVPAFVADYGLAPERPFPAAIDDARRAYDALARTSRGSFSRSLRRVAGGRLLPSSVGRIFQAGGGRGHCTLR